MSKFEAIVLILMIFQSIVLLIIGFTLGAMKYWLKNIDTWCGIFDKNSHHYGMRKEAMLKGIGQSVGARNSDSRGYFI